MQIRQMRSGDAPARAASPSSFAHLNVVRPHFFNDSHVPVCRIGTTHSSIPHHSRPRAQVGCAQVIFCHCCSNSIAVFSVFELLNVVVSTFIFCFYVSQIRPASLGIQSTA